MEPVAPTQLVEGATARYGLLGAGIVILGLALVYVFRLYLAANGAAGRERESAAVERERRDARETSIRVDHTVALATRDAVHDKAVAQLKIEHENERGKHAQAIAALKLEHEVDRRELSAEYAKALTEQVRLAREDAALARRECAEQVERLSSEIVALANKQSATTDKLTERLIVQRGPNGRY